MIFIVRTNNRRILHESYNQIDAEILNDLDNKPIESFIEALYKISDEGGVILEDDLVLCHNFKDEIIKAVSRFPDKIINFFQAPRLCRKIIEQSDIWYNQCTYYPKGVAKQIADIMVTLPRNTGIRKNQYSLLESQALKILGIQVIQYRPHLVQHLDFDTFLFPRTDHHRRSLFFLDYLTELGISYDEAYLHIHELENLMNLHFEELCKQKNQL